jgi:hypothetical protein
LPGAANDQVFAIDTGEDFFATGGGALAEMLAQGGLVLSKKMSL